MSKKTKVVTEELVTRKAKYRVRNAEGKYELVYLETSADQVVESAEKKFVTEAEKQQIAQHQTAIDGIDGKVNAAKSEAIESANSHTDGEISRIDREYKAADQTIKQEAIADAEQKINAAKSELNGRIGTVEQKANTNEQGITELKGLLAKNSTAYVVPTATEISTVVTTPKVGDIVYVVDEKKSYIYKGTETLVVFEKVLSAGVPEGWVLLSEVEINLEGYLTTVTAEATYRKKADKIVEVDLDSVLQGKINGKLDASAVDGKINAIVNPIKSSLEEKINAKLDTSAVGEKVNEIVNPIKSNLEGQIATKLNQSQVDARVDAKLNPAKAELTQAINQKGQEVTQAFQSADAQINQKIDNLVPTLAKVQPEGKVEGHVWLEIVGENE